MSQKEEPSRILKYLYLGGKVHAKDKELLQKLNITHVVNCSPSRSVDKNFGIPNYFKKEGDITYLRVPIFDNKGEDITPYLETVFSFISHAKHYGNILVHCLRGVSRSTSFVMGYLMRDNEMTVDEALQHVEMYRSIVQPNGAFLAQLRRYEEKLIVERQEAESPVQKETTSSQVTVAVAGVDVPRQQALMQAQVQVQVQVQMPGQPVTTTTSVVTATAVTATAPATATDVQSRSPTPPAVTVGASDSVVVIVGKEDITEVKRKDEDNSDNDEEKVVVKKRKLEASIS